MSDIWFISDTHFCDEDIMRFEPILPDGVHTRTDLDEYIIERWNSVVRPEDVVYHLGDVGKFSSEEDAEQIIKRLNGDKYLIMGNHDYGNAELASDSAEQLEYRERRLRVERGRAFVAQYIFRIHR